MKAIIELTSWKTSQARAVRAAKRADAGKPVSADYTSILIQWRVFSRISPPRECK